MGNALDEEAGSSLLAPIIMRGREVRAPRNEALPPRPAPGWRLKGRLLASRQARRILDGVASTRTFEKCVALKMLHYSCVHHDRRDTNLKHKQVLNVDGLWFVDQYMYSTCICKKTQTSRVELNPYYPKNRASINLTLSP